MKNPLAARTWGPAYLQGRIEFGVISQVTWIFTCFVFGDPDLNRSFATITGKGRQPNIAKLVVFLLKDVAHWTRSSSESIIDIPPQVWFVGTKLPGSQHSWIVIACIDTLGRTQAGLLLLACECHCLDENVYRLRVSTVSQWLLLRPLRVTEMSYSLWN